MSGGAGKAGGYTGPSGWTTVNPQTEADRSAQVSQQPDPFAASTASGQQPPKARRESIDALIEKYRADANNPIKNRTNYTSPSGNTTMTGRQVSMRAAVRKNREAV